MSRKSTPRIVRDPMAWITKAMPLGGDQLRDLGIAYHASLQAMLRGNGTEQAWRTLACSLNIALLLCEQGHCAGAIDTIKLAQQALMSSRARAQKFKRWAFNGDEAHQVMTACNLHDEQLSRCTRKQITDALREVHRRVEADEVLA